MQISVQHSKKIVSRRDIAVLFIKGTCLYPVRPTILEGRYVEKYEKEPFALAAIQPSGVSVV